MKKLFVAALLLAGTAVVNPALAERWSAPMNGMASTVMMPDGTVMMKVQMPPKEFEAMVAAMHAGNGCMIQEIYPDAHNTMILVCK
jgi:hypothetical protein